MEAIDLAWQIGLNDALKPVEADGKSVEREADEVVAGADLIGPDANHCEFRVPGRHRKHQVRELVLIRNAVGGAESTFEPNHGVPSFLFDWRILPKDHAAKDSRLRTC